MTNEASQLSIRTLREDEIALAVDWAAGEGWNPGLTDAASFFAADPEGFLGGFLDGSLASIISATAYSDDFGFLGFYIVRPDLRGRGLGIQIWDAAIERLASRNIGLDGVLEQQANYERSGFKLAYRNVRYEGTARTGTVASGLVDVKNLTPFRIVEYDRRFFPALRPSFLQAWLTAEGATGLASLHDEDITGYGVVRPARQGYKIGPIFANDPATAEKLLDGLCASIPDGATFYFDVPQPNQTAVRLAEARGMKPVFETVRMYNRETPDLPISDIYGVTSFELG